MAENLEISLDSILQAAALLKNKIVHTPFLPAPQLSALTGAEVWVKFENMHVTSSFKERGAYTKLIRLTEEERKRGVIAMSAGNHAQALAYHAQKFGIASTIVMPEGTPFVKVENTTRFGARVCLEGKNISESQIRVEAMMQAENLVLVHPYDDPDIIAGQGTIALEMIEDGPDLDLVLIPMGGGGLIAGNAVAFAALRPNTKVIGVEVETYASVYNAVHHTTLPIGGATLAEGIAVKKVGARTLPIIQKYVTDHLIVKEEKIEEAINIFATHLHAVAEGAGAVGLAALLDRPEHWRGKKIGLILTGGNIDTRLLASIMVRALEREDRIIAFRLTGEDRPGLLGQISSKLGVMGANILEVSHRRTFLSVPAREVSVDVTIETRNKEHAQSILTSLMADGYKLQRIDGNGTVLDR